MVLSLRIESPDWDGAKCRMPYDAAIEDFDIPFEEPDLQVAICNGTYDDTACPRREICAWFALLNNEEYAIWGGFTEEQRKWIRKNIRQRNSWEWSYPELWREEVPSCEPEQPEDESQPEPLLN